LKRQLFLTLAVSFQCVFALLLAACPAGAWGPQGHRVAALLTEPLLDEETRLEVRALLGDQSLADASTWADRMRDNPSPYWQRQAGPYHYVTVPPGKTYAEVGAPAKGDSVTALREFRGLLEDESAPRVRRQLALRFSIHIIQDLHQPLHVGNGSDRGGNDIKVTVRGEGSNLHRVWDSTLISAAGRSDRNWVSRLDLDGMLREELADCSDDPESWIAESARLRDRIYPTGRGLDDAYFRKHLPAVEQRLQASAIATACWLNAALPGDPDNPDPMSRGLSR
jgi:hypothetical protein